MVTEKLVNALQNFQLNAQSEFADLQTALYCWSRVEKVAGVEWTEYLDAVYEVELALEEMNNAEEALYEALDLAGYVGISVSASRCNLDLSRSKFEAAVLKRNETKKAFEEAASSELNTANDRFRSAEIHLASVERSLVSKREWGNVRQIIAEHKGLGLPHRCIAETFPFFWMRMVDEWVKTHLGDGHPLHASVLRQQDGRDDLDSHATDEKRLQDQRIKDILVKKFGLVCWGCGFKPPDVRYLELDHVSPKSEGGPHDINNRALLCGPCNRKKSDKITLIELQRTNKREGNMQNSAKLPNLKEARERTRELMKKARNDESA